MKDWFEFELFYYVCLKRIQSDVKVWGHLIINTSIQPRCIHLIWSDSKDKNISISNKCRSFELSIHQSIQKNKMSLFHKTMKNDCFQHFNNQKCFLSSKSVYYNDFWRSCDTEDWSNDAENTAAHHRNKLHFKIYSNKKQLFKTVIIFHNITVFTVF